MPRLILFQLRCNKSCSSISYKCLKVPYLFTSVCVCKFPTYLSIPGVLITWEPYSLSFSTAHLVPGDNIQKLKMRIAAKAWLWTVTKFMATDDWSIGNKNFTGDKTARQQEYIRAKYENNTCLLNPYLISCDSSHFVCLERGTKTKQYGEDAIPFT